MDKARDLQLDIIRCLAIYFVINVHCLDTIDEAYYNEGLTSLGGIISNTIYYLKNAGVPFFVMLSGALLLGREEPIKEFLKSRISRIFIPFLIWSVIVYLLSAFRHHDPIENLSFSDFLFRFFSNGVIGIYWFVYMIFGLYIVTPILQRAFSSDDKRSERIVTYAAALLLTVYLVGEFATCFKVINGLKSQNIVYITLFVWGFYIYKFLQRKVFYKKWAFISFIIATSALFANICFHYCSTYIFQYLWPAFFFAIILSIDFHVKNIKVSKYIEFVSNISYGIYLSHFLIISGLMRIYKCPVLWAYPILYPILTLLLCSSIFYVINKSVMRKYLM